MNVLITNGEKNYFGEIAGLKEAALFLQIYLLMIKDDPCRAEKLLCLYGFGFCPEPLPEGKILWCRLAEKEVVEINSSCVYDILTGVKKGYPENATCRTQEDFLNIFLPLEGWLD